MQAYLNDPKLKEKFIAELEWHKEQDAIKQGTYGEGSGKEFKGCAVGCSINSLNRINKTSMDTSDHEVYEPTLGFPRVLAYLEDEIFEGLTSAESKDWPLRFAQAIKPGADLSLVTAKFVVWQFESAKHGLKNIDEVKDDAEVFGFCEDVVALYKRVLAGDPPTEDEFYDLYLRIDRARAGARAGAGAWARAWARAGARAWAGAGAGAGAGARAWAGAGAWAGADNYHEQYTIMADKLIELLEEA